MPKRWRGMRLGRVLVAVAGAVVVAGGLAVTAPAAQALGSGTVCMLNAPSGAPVGPARMGHVGWAFRVGGTSSWEYGATESPSRNWRASGSQTAMFNAFRNVSPGYYTQWRCKDTPNSSVGAASRKVDQLYAQSYSALWDNCLTRTVAIFKAYDNSLSNLPDGGATGPNYYFDNLGGYGFGPKHPL